MSRVLDVPCGTGRVGTRLAAAATTSSGVDITERFLEMARAAVTVRRAADMRELPFDEEFDAAICMWGSFGYFDDAGNLAQARAAARALKPGGRYLIDTPELETICPRFRERDWFEVEGTASSRSSSFRLGRGARRDRVDVPSGGRSGTRSVVDARSTHCTS